MSSKLKTDLNVRFVFLNQMNNIFNRCHGADADIAAYGAITAKDDFYGLRFSAKFRVPPTWAR